MSRTCCLYTSLGHYQSDAVRCLKHMAALRTIFKHHIFQNSAPTSFCTYRSLRFVVQYRPVTGRSLLGRSRRNPAWFDLYMQAVSATRCGVLILNPSHHFARAVRRRWVAQAFTGVNNINHDTTEVLRRHQPEVQAHVIATTDITNKRNPSAHHSKMVQRSRKKQHSVMFIVNTFTACCRR